MPVVCAQEHVHMVTYCHNSDSGYVQMNEFGMGLLFPIQGYRKEHKLWRQADLDEKTLGDPEKLLYRYQPRFSFL